MIKFLNYFAFTLILIYLIGDIYFFANNRIGIQENQVFEFPLEPMAIVFLKWGLLMLILFFIFKQIKEKGEKISKPLLGISLLIIGYFIYNISVGNIYRSSFLDNIHLFEFIAFIILIVQLGFSQKIKSN